MAAQETIVFDRAMVKRDLQVRLAVGATFTGIESVVLGRAEMGETVQRVWLRDGWRIWRGDRLIYADAFNLGGDASESAYSRANSCKATAPSPTFFMSVHGPKRYCSAFATLWPIANAICGAAPWNGMLSVRLVARDGATCGKP
jgi:urease accessory protein